MQPIDIYQIDAFAIRLFAGNPAAVCVLNEWLPVSVMQKIALENNLSETAFIVRESNEWSIRWFTPETEVDLCGHATLASAFVVLTILHPENHTVVFRSQKMGNLTVRKKADMLELDFPSDKSESCSLPEILIEGLGKAPLECYKGRSDYLLLYGNESDIINLKPDFSRLAHQASTCTACREVFQGDRKDGTFSS